MHWTPSAVTEDGRAVRYKTVFGDQGRRNATSPDLEESKLRGVSTHHSRVYIIGGPMSMGGRVSSATRVHHVQVDAQFRGRLNIKNSYIKQENRGNPSTRKIESVRLLEKGNSCRGLRWGREEDRTGATICL